MSDDGWTGLERTLATLIRESRATLRTAVTAMGADLDPASYTLLVYLQKNPGVPMSQIADAQCVGRGTMSRQVARLEKLGLVERTTDPEDNRVQRVRLTEATSRRLREVRDAMADRLHGALSTWSAQDVSRLEELLGRFVEDYRAVARD